MISILIYIYFYSFERRRDTPRSNDMHNFQRSLHQQRLPSDMRSVKSLDFDSENESKNSAPSNDTASEARHTRPTPPKKPLRLSLQRAQSLQTVELNINTEQERKRAQKRAHMQDKSMLMNDVDPSGQTNTECVLIENCTPLHTASLGRQKHHI